MASKLRTLLPIRYVSFSLVLFCRLVRSSSRSTKTRCNTKQIGKSSINWQALNWKERRRSSFKGIYMTVSAYFPYFELACASRRIKKGNLVGQAMRRLSMRPRLSQPINTGANLGERPEGGSRGQERYNAHIKTQDAPLGGLEDGGRCVQVASSTRLKAAGGACT